MAHYRAICTEILDVIGIDKPTDLGIVITALEVIQFGLLVANIATEAILSVRG